MKKKIAFFGLLCSLFSCRTALVAPQFVPVVIEKDGTKSLTAKSCRISLKNLTYDEPNNGRMLWRVDVYYKGENINHQFFYPNWNHITFAIDQLMLEDAKGKYAYVPSGNDKKLMRQSNGEIIELPWVGSPSNDFVGNVFVGNYLLEFYTSQLRLTHLKTLEYFLYPTNLPGKVTTVKLAGKRKIWFEYYDTESKERGKNSKVVHFRAFEKVAP